MLTHKILVSGALGFTGSHLTRELVRKGAKVITIKPDGDPVSPVMMKDGLIDKVTCVPGTVLDYDLLLRTIGDHGIDTVIHLAAVSVERQAHQDPRSSFEVNIRGTYNLLEACRRHPDTVTRVVVASSDKVYGDSPTLPYTEEFPLLGIYAYDASKSCADLLARSYFHSFALPVCVARFANIYGEGDLNWSRLVPNTVRHLFHNEPPLVRFPRDGVYKRDFLYIEDQVQAYLALLEGMARPDVHGLAFNFGQGCCISVAEVVAKIQKLMNREDIRPSFKPSDHGEIIQQQLSCERARRLLGWEPARSLDDGLAETVEWYTQYLRSSV